jgi:molybdenum-dependent DNA-binding transcriptional regulator ModE
VRTFICKFLTALKQASLLIEMSFKYTPAALKKIEQIFDEAKYLVRYEKGNFASGYCVLEHRKVVVINKFLNVEGRINALLEILPSIPAAMDSLSGESQKLLDQLNIKLSKPEEEVEVIPELRDKQSEREQGQENTTPEDSNS